MEREHERRIDDYVRRLGWSLQRLEPAERTGIVGEIRQHLTECAEAGEDPLAQALAGLGAPHALGRRYLEEFAMADALGRPAPTRLFFALTERASRSAAATGTVFAAAILYTFALAAAVIAVAKPIASDRVGAWHGATGWQAGFLASPPPAPELVGGWIVPLAVAASLACYLLATALLRRTGWRLLGQGTTGR